MKRQRYLSSFLITICLWSANLLTAQDVNYFLQTEGPDIVGSSTTEDYVDWINVISYGIAVFNANVSDATSGSGGSELESVEFLIQGDVKVIPALFKAAAKGSPFTKMTLHALSSTGVSAYQPVVIILEECVITSMAQEGTQGDLPVFSIQVKADKLTIKTTSLKPDGTADDPKEEGWDFKGNIEL